MKKTGNRITLHLPCNNTSSVFPNTAAREQLPDEHKNSNRNTPTRQHERPLLQKFLLARLWLASWLSVNDSECIRDKTQRSVIKRTSPGWRKYFCRTQKSQLNTYINVLSSWIGFWSRKRLKKRSFGYKTVKESNVNPDNSSKSQIHYSTRSC
jgi:hypothetical protein